MENNNTQTKGEKTMKAYTQTIRMSNNHGDSWDLVMTVYPDPKRPGMYKETSYHTNHSSGKDTLTKSGKPYTFAGLYGKKNQAELLEMIKTMDEV